MYLKKMLTRVVSWVIAVNSVHWGLRLRGRSGMAAVGSAHNSARMLQTLLLPSPQVAGAPLVCVRLDSPYAGVRALALCHVR